MPKRKLNNVTQRADGRFVARKAFGYKQDGTPNRKSFYASTAAEAAQKLAAYERQIENGLSVDANNVTFGKWLTLWLCEYKINSLRPTTYDNYENIINVRIIPALGHHKLLQLRAEHLQAFVNDMRLHSGEKPAAGTIRKVRNIMYGALNQAVKNGLITRNPANALSLPKSDNKRKAGAFTPNEQSALLNALKGHRLYALFAVALGTGMRIGEILALRWVDVDFDKQYIAVSSSVARSKDREISTGAALTSSIKVTAPKTAAGMRSVPLTAEIRRILLEHQTRQLDERDIAADVWLDNGLVFCTPTGNYLDYRNVTRIYQAKRDTANLPKLPFHSLRHTFATNAVSAGVDYYYLSRVMGHTNIAITLNTYADYMPDKSRAEINKMDGILIL